LTASAADTEVEFHIEHSRLVISTSVARFALPRLSITLPKRPEIPVLGTATGLREAAAIVADATARDGLPLFTAVRIRSAGDRLTLVATDRFRAAYASVPWLPGRGEVDALVPSAALAGAMRYADREVPVRAGNGWFGIDWPGGGMAVPQLALPFPDAQIAALLASEPVATVEVEADTLRAAVDRVTPFALKGILLSIADGAVVVQGWGEMGEAREEVKASVAGAGKTTALYQPRYLADAVRAFSGQTVTIQVQHGIRPTVFGGGDLTYLVVPLRQPDDRSTVGSADEVRPNGGPIRCTAGSGWPLIATVGNHSRKGPGRARTS
jgi:DNA polymerase-3 subunit beta